MILAPGQWSPRKLTGLVLDLNAAAGVTVVGGYITAAADQSGLGNDGVGEGKVTLTANAFGTLPGFNCGGNDLRIKNTACRLFPLNGPRHIFCVFRPENQGSAFATGGVIFSSPYTAVDTSGCFAVTYGYLSPSVWGYFSSRVSGTTITDNGYASGTAYVYEISGADGTGASKLVVRANGTAKVCASATKAAETDTTGYCLGSPPGTWKNYFPGGAIGRVLVFNRVLSNYEAACVRQFLGAKYGITTL